MHLRSIILLALSVHGHRPAPDPRTPPDKLAEAFRHRLKPGNYKRYLTYHQQEAILHIIQSVAQRPGGIHKDEPGRCLVSYIHPTALYAIIDTSSYTPWNNGIAHAIRTLAYKKLRHLNWPRETRVFTQNPWATPLETNEIPPAIAAFQVLQQLPRIPEPPTSPTPPSTTDDPPASDSPKG